MMISVIVYKPVSGTGVSNSLRKFSIEKLDNYEVIEANGDSKYNAFNASLEKCKGEYLLFIDGSNETINKENLRNLSKQFNQETTDIVFLDYTVEYEQGGKEQVIANTFGQSSNDILQAILSRKYPSTIANILFSRSFLLRNSVCFDEKITNYNELLFIVRSLLSHPEIQYVSTSIFCQKKTGRRPENPCIQSEISCVIQDWSSFEVVFNFIKSCSNEIELQFLYRFINEEKRKAADYQVFRSRYFDKYAPTPLGSIMQMNWNNQEIRKFICAIILNRLHLV